MHACHAATSHRHRGRAIVIVIILTASEGTPHYAPPETEPNWLLSLPTDLVIREQEEGSERGREGGREESRGATAKERHPLHIHQSLFHLVAYLSASAAAASAVEVERRKPRHSRRGPRGPRSVVRPGINMANQQHGT